MDSAIDLFRAGASVSARQTDHGAVATMRTVCPRCFEQVHLVVRAATSYFAHPPWKKDSPACPLRTESWGDPSARASDGSHEPLPPNRRFRDALLAAYSLSGPPQAPEGGAEVGEAAAVMHRVFREQGRTVTAADFADASPFLRDRWTTDEEMVRGFLERPGFLSGRLREDLRGEPVLQGEAHRKSVVLLWRHLHLAQVADDLLLLLRVTAHLFRPVLVADLAVSSLGVLAWVPWDVLWAAQRGHLCGECGRSFTLPAAANPARCSECLKELCPDCENPCSGCGDVLCESCIFDSCPACSGILCPSCSHLAWECAACGATFCEGGVDEDPEPVDKIECDGCVEPYCGDCAEGALQPWGDESLCESCREEREQDFAEAATDAG